MKQKEAQKLLETCEQGLRKLVAEAAGEGDYAGVVRITEWAKTIAGLAAEDRVYDRISPTVLAVGAIPSATAKRDSPVRGVTNGRRVRIASDTYPKFFRRGDELVKVGWSKKDRKEYNHRAPRPAVNAVAATVKRVGEKGRLFNGDALLPVNDAGGAAVPDYQAYVALAWLKHLGVVEQRGRRAGYTLVPSKQIDSAITASWSELAEWRG